MNGLRILYDSGQWDRLESEARRLAARHPANPIGWKALGLALQAMGVLPEAAGALSRAAGLAPPDANTQIDLGTILRQMGRFAEAETCCHRALAIRPDFTEAHNNLGNVLYDLGRLAEAEVSYRRTLALRPDSAETHYNLGRVLRDLGRLAEAEACCRRALAIRPDFVEAQGSLLFSLNYQARPPEPCLEEARKYGRMVAAKAKSRFSVRPRIARPGRLRVGLVSGDLRRHPVGYFLEGILAGIGPARIELFAYPTAPESDDMTARLQPCFAAWRPLFGLDDEAAARLIHEDGVHVLIDLSGHTAHNRLPVFAWRPAPVQASWLGYYATTGVAEMDWFLADETGVPPEHRGHFTEKVWYLPETRLCFTPPEAAEPVAPLPALQRGFPCFGSFQQLPKINDGVLRLWGRVLGACPDARLRLQNDALSDPEVVTALSERMTAQGIDPGRVDLHGAMPRQDYLAAHAEVDLLLDTFPFTGGTTTCEALWMGVPTVTLAGDTLIARQGASLLTAAGLPDWIAESEDGYVAKAIDFASDLEGLARLRSGLRERVKASPLFDAPRFARALEDALWGMWEARVEKVEG